MDRFQKQKDDAKKIALDHIRHLFAEAEKAKTQELADRYVQLARKMQMKHKVRMPSELKKRFCKHCLTYFVHGKNVRVRSARGKMVYYCLSCKKYMRHPYLKEKKARQKA